MSSYNVWCRMANDVAGSTFSDGGAASISIELLDPGVAGVAFTKGLKARMMVNKTDMAAIFSAQNPLKSLESEVLCSSPSKQLKLGLKSD